jgi:glycosyltransferase involved in cell wall biosynthesis
MNILQISAAADTGGAGRAMSRLHQGLRRQGHVSDIVARLRGIPEPHTLTVSEATGRSNSPPRRLLNNVQMQLDAWFSLPSVYDSTRRILNTELFRQAEVIQLHNLHGWYFNYKLLPQFSSLKPVIWTLHDMWALTGHCAYAYDCQRWRTRCFDCPQLKRGRRKFVEPRPALLDRTSHVWERKRSLYQRSKLHIVTPSRWMADQARNSILSGAADVQCIPYGIDLDTFSPKDQASARNALGIRQDAKVILFVAARVIQGRKGLGYLFEALGSIRANEDILLLTVGNSEPSQQQLQRYEQKHLGHIADDTKLSLVYSAADLYVLPTLADNLPLTVQESLASGTPVVAFDVGGLPEMIAHLATGYLARYKEAADLATGIRKILDDDALRLQMRETCRSFAVKHYDLNRQANRYVELYEHVIRAERPHTTRGDR